MSTQLLDPRTRPEQTSPPKGGPSRRPTRIVAAIGGAIAAIVVTGLLVTGGSEPQETFSPERVRAENFVPPSGNSQSLDDAEERALKAYTDRLNGLAEHYGVPGSPGTDYFEVHRTLDVEHAGETLSLLAAHISDDAESVEAETGVAMALDAVNGLLDGICRTHDIARAA